MEEGVEIASTADTEFDTKDEEAAVATETLPETDEIVSWEQAHDRLDHERSVDMPAPDEVSQHHA